jgi:hypothetical protein
MTSHSRRMLCGAVRYRSGSACSESFAMLDVSKALGGANPKLVHSPWHPSTG